MPTYDYRCTQCAHLFETSQKITEAPLKMCPHCGKEALQRGPGGGIGLSFKGPGFYINDYAPARTSASGEEASNSSACCPCGKSSEPCSS